MTKIINGIYKRNIYKSDKGYIIGLLKITDTDSSELEDFVNKTITFTGYFHDLKIDDSYSFVGDTLEHPKYGFQFQVEKYERIKPSDKDGIVEFLSSDLFPGIGKSIATLIVDRLGMNAINIILENDDALIDIPKLSNKKAQVIVDNLKKYEESNETYIYLTSIGFSIKDAMTIYNYYKSKTMDIINNDVYQIIKDIEEISFPKIDEIATNQGLDLNNSNRIKACILYVMKYLVYQNGDTYLEYFDIYKYVQTYLKMEINSEEFEEYLYELEKNYEIVKYNNVYYLVDMFKAENNVVNQIIYLASKKTSKVNDIDNHILKIEKREQISYNDKQREAIIKALENNITIITGGPGTGKTTIIKAIVELYSEINKLSFEELSERVALLAPTGRASKRMSEATCLPASTIHRFLKWDKENNEFCVNEYNPNINELIIVDEASMVDINLFSSLFKGLTKNIKLILVGDHNQLPSVGPGRVLKDLIDSEIIDTINLEYLYRQDENSYINTLAKEIKDNDLSETFLESKSDYTFLECDQINIKESIKNICTKLINKGYDYKRVQIMAPMYHGENGIDNLNKELQKVFNPLSNEKNEIIYGDTIFRENDKVLQLVNQPDLNVFNGDIGVIKKIVFSSNSKSGKDEITIDFDGILVTYTSKDFNKFKHGFIISIHKSQGSEFELVVIPVCNAYKRMLYRKLIYTAITRAKRKLILLGEPQAFIYSVNNTSEYVRKSYLLERIQETLYNK